MLLTTREWLEVLGLLVMLGSNYVSIRVGLNRLEVWKQEGVEKWRTATDGRLQKIEEAASKVLVLESKVLDIERRVNHQEALCQDRHESGGQR